MLENFTLMEENQIKKKHRARLSYIKLFEWFGSKSQHLSVIWGKIEVS
jgi:hypothetical protein